MMIRYGQSLGILQRQQHELGDIISMTEDVSVFTSYFRNNALHLMLMPSLIACAFLNNPSVWRDDLYRLAGRVYPYAADEYFLRWGESELPGVVDELLEDLLNHGLLTANEERTVWLRPPAESPEAVQLSVLARATVPIIERYYLSGQGEANLRSMLDDGLGQLPRLRFDKPLRYSQLHAEQLRGLLIFLTQQTVGGHKVLSHS